jgi:hypothetical protein
MYDALSPIYSRRENPNAIDTEVIRLGMGLKKPQREIGYEGGVSVNLEHFPWIYDRYVELAGNELEHPATGKGAFDTLNDLVEGNHILSQVYRMQTDGAEGGKATFIQGQMSFFKEMARRRLLEEFPNLAEIVVQRRQDNLEKKLMALDQ